MERQANNNCAEKNGAREIAAFLEFGLVDMSSGVAATLQRPGTFDRSISSIRSSTTDIPTPPDDARSVATADGDQLTITIPPEKLSLNVLRRSLWVIAIGASAPVLLVYLAGATQPGDPGLYIVLLLWLTACIPLAFFLYAVAERTGTTTVVETDKGQLRVTTTFRSRSKTASIAMNRVKDIRIATRYHPQDARKQLALQAHAETPFPLFGFDLSVDELYWLRDVILKAAQHGNTTEDETPQFQHR